MDIQHPLHEELSRLFKFAPPGSLHRTLLYVFMDFLQQDKDDLPDDLKAICTDFFYLLNFLQHADELIKTE